ncbi:MAG: response regulator [Clostridia bacterium]|nr:response regulator [Clostridia bacterium]
MEIRVLVVEDEPFMREAYLTLLDWQENGFSLVDCVQNGEKAMEVLEKSDIDIIITDLKMPKMSGIELVRACSTAFPKVRFIVVSGYDDFHLVKEAFSLGIKDYFLKYEIDADAILSVLLKLKKEIIDSKKLELQTKMDTEEVSRLRELEKIIGTSHYMLHEKLLKELIWSHGNSVTLMERLLKCGIELVENSIYIMVVTIHQYYEYEYEQWQGDRELIKYGFLNIFEEICRQKEHCYAFCNLPNEYVVIFTDEHGHNETYFADFYEEINNALKQCFNLNCSAGLSDEATSFNKLKELYRNAKLACEYNYIYGEEKLVLFESVRKVGVQIQTSENLLRLKTVLSSFNTGDIQGALKDLRVNPDSVGCEQISEIKNLFHMYYNEIENFAEKEKLKAQIAEELKAYFPAKNADSLPKMNKWLFNILNSIASIFNNEYVIVKAKNYIKSHYKENITLTSVANMLQISEGHLSRIFKKKQHETFSQYLLKTRMEAAVDLLKNSNLKIYQIAYEVGYSNPEQFSRMFKQVIGKSPKSFLKQE